MRIGSWSARVVALIAILLVVAVGRWPWLAFRPGFGWCARGDREWWFLLAAIPAFFAAAAPALLRPRDRRAVRAFALVSMAVPAFRIVAPAFCAGEIAALATWVDRDGVCRQRTGYTCGPAAAVTALRVLGVPAEESALALRAGTSRWTGTPYDNLCMAIDAIHGEAGVSCEFRRFGTANDMVPCLPVIAPVKYLPPFIDHYVTVLSVGPGTVVVGDPLGGLERVPMAEFESSWRGCGIAVTRRPTRRGPGPEEVR